MVVQGAGSGSLTCGDSVLIFGLDDRRSALILVDVAGHGSSRAALSSQVVGIVRRELMRTGSPARALLYADRFLRSSKYDLPYAVGFAAVVDTQTWNVVYASAGHDAVFLLDARGAIHVPETTGPMLGIPTPVYVCEALLVLERDQVLVASSDGVSDSRAPGSTDFFGHERTALTIRQALRDGANPARAVIDAAMIHADGKQADDASVIIARRAVRESVSG